MRRNLNTQDGGNLRQKMLIKLFINHLGFVTNAYEQGYYSLNRNGFFIEIVIQVKIRSTSLCVKKKLHAIYFSLFSNKLLPRVNYFSLIWFVNILGFWLKSKERTLQHVESLQMLQCLQHPNSIKFVMKWTKHIRSWIFDSISFQTRTTAVYSVHWIEFHIHFLQLQFTIMTKQIKST